MTIPELIEALIKKVTEEGNYAELAFIFVDVRRSKMLTYGSNSGSNDIKSIERRSRN